MKTLFINIVLLPISLLACCNSKNQRPSAFLPGTYVNQARSIYSVAWDTLLLSRDEHSPNFYQIVRGAGFQRIEGGRLGPKQYLVKTFRGIWDETNQLLQIVPDGPVLIFQPDAGTLTLGSAIYHKLN